MVVTGPLVAAGREPFRGLGRHVISLRKMTLGSGYRYLMESVAAGDGGRQQSTSLTRYYAQSGTPPGVFLGGGLVALDDARGVEKGSAVSEEHLFNLLGMCADPVTGQALGRPPIRPHRSRGIQVAESDSIRADGSSITRADGHSVKVDGVIKGSRARTPVAGFDLTFSPSKSVSVAWALADHDTRAVIYACHRRAIDIVLTYAEREVFHSRSGKGGIVQEDVEGVVAVAFTHWDSRAGDPQLHDHVIVANRARSVSDGAWRTLDGRDLFKSVVALSELQQGVLSDLLTESLGWGWDGRTRRHSDQLRFEVTGVPEALMAEFSQRSSAIEQRKTVLISEYAAAHGRQPTTVEVLKLRQRATLETRTQKEHHRLAEMTERWQDRAATYVGAESQGWVATLANRNDLPLLHASDLAEGILADAVGVAVRTVAERRATFSRANILAELHRQFQGVRFVSPEERIAVVERAAGLAVAQSLLISAPELHHTPEYLRRADGTSRFRAKGHEVYTTGAVLEAEARLLDAGRQGDGPRVEIDRAAANDLARRNDSLSVDQARAVEQIATSGRSLDVLVGPAGTGKSTIMAALRAVWETEYGPGSVLGLAPSAAAADVLAEQLRIDTENSAKWLYEHRQEADRLLRVAELRSRLRSGAISSRLRSALRTELAKIEAEVAPWRLRARQLVIVDEASLAGTFALDELVTATRAAGAKVLLVGDPAQLSAVEAGGMFSALVRDRKALAPELTDVRRFVNKWEKTASVELREGSPDAIDAYEAHDRVTAGNRDQMLEALYGAWKADIEANKTTLMIAGDLGTVAELNARAQGERIAAEQVSGEQVAVAGGSAGVGDQVVTRQNNRRVATGRRWVRNGDQWSVTAAHRDGSLRLKRAHGTGEVLLPADYVRQHVELAYASTAYRAQGRTVDTAHAMVSPSTTREVLYVSATRGKEANRLYVDTQYDPDPQTSHGDAAEPVTAKDVLVGVLRHEGSDVAAHEVIRRQHHEAEGMERLSAEYLTLANDAQAERWNGILASSGISGTDLATISASEAFGPLSAALREAESRGLDVDAAVPQLVTGRSLADAADIASVLHARVQRWARAAGGRGRHTENLVAGLIPRAQGVTDPDLAQALAERDQAMEKRSRVLTLQAIEAQHAWVRSLGVPPSEPARRARWLREVSVVAAYRDRWHVEGQRPLDSVPDRANTEQMDQRKRARAAGERAMAMATLRVSQNHRVPILAAEIQVKPQTEVDL